MVNKELQMGMFFFLSPQTVYYMYLDTVYVFHNQQLVINNMTWKQQEMQLEASKLCETTFSRVKHEHSLIGNFFSYGEFETVN